MCLLFKNVFFYFLNKLASYVILTLNNPTDVYTKLVDVAFSLLDKNFNFNVLNEACANSPMNMGSFLRHP